MSAERNPAEILAPGQRALELGRTLFEAVRAAEDGTQLLERTKEVFWGLRAEAALADFESLWGKLRAAGHTRLLQALRRDGAGTLWAEERGGFKVLVVIDPGSALPDNTTVYLLRRPEGADAAVAAAKTQFRALSAWPRAKRSGFRFGDHRDIAQPSLATLSGCGYRYGFGDFRDPCHIFTMRYAATGPYVASASATEEKIGRALDDLQRLSLAIDECLRSVPLLARS